MASCAVRARLRMSFPPNRYQPPQQQQRQRRWDNDREGGSAYGRNNNNNKNDSNNSVGDVGDYGYPQRYREVASEGGTDATANTYRNANINANANASDGGIGRDSQYNHHQRQEYGRESQFRNANWRNNRNQGQSNALRAQEDHYREQGGNNWNNNHHQQQQDNNQNSYRNSYNNGPSQQLNSYTGTQQYRPSAADQYIPSRPFQNRQHGYDSYQPSGSSRYTHSQAHPRAPYNAADRDQNRDRRDRNSNNRSNSSSRNDSRYQPPTRQRSADRFRTRRNSNSRMDNSLYTAVEGLKISDRKPKIRPDQDPKVSLLPVPIVDSKYQAKAEEEPILMEDRTTKPILVILDLNGALVYRICRKSGELVHRAHLDTFTKVICGLAPADKGDGNESLSAKKTEEAVKESKADADFLRDHAHLQLKPFVWSSASAVNVGKVVNSVFSDEERTRIVGTWNRSNLRLGKFTKQNVQVYKQLSWIWEDPAIQATHPDAIAEQAASKAEAVADPKAAETGPPADPKRYWDQTNTILVDDSDLKGMAEPHNLVLLPEFDGYVEDDVERNGDVLLDMLRYVDVASRYENVSAFIRKYPFQDVDKKWIELE